METYNITDRTAKIHLHWARKAILLDNLKSKRQLLLRKHKQLEAIIRKNGASLKEKIKALALDIKILDLEPKANPSVNNNMGQGQPQNNPLTKPDYYKPRHPLTGPADGRAAPYHRRTQCPRNYTKP